MSSFMRMSVVAVTQFEAVHCWPSAPEEVGFLANLHRHIFHVRLRVEVTHSDRQIEFILLKRWLEQTIRSAMQSETGWWNETISCEAIARNIIQDALREVVSQECTMACSVSEDGENGAIVEYIVD